MYHKGHHEPQWTLSFQTESKTWRLSVNSLYSQMQILGLVSSLHDAASRLRISQYQSYFKEFGHQLDIPKFKPEREANPAGWTKLLNKVTGINEWRTWNAVKTYNRLSLIQKQKDYDVVWQNRLILPYHDYFEKKFTKPVVFDFDDAIWINEGKKQVITAITNAKMVFAGNDYLADFASSYNKDIAVIPTTVDTEKIKPLQKKQQPFTVGWIGTESNFKYLELIRKPVMEFVIKNNDTRFILVSSNQPPSFPFDGQKIIFKQWNQEKENELVNEFNIGIMPLEDNDWTRGKCSYKMLQYLACGIPVVASPVGNNKKLFAESVVGLPAVGDKEWLKSFEQLKKDNDFYTECSNNGRVLVEERYSCKSWSQKIITLFSQIT